MDWLCCGAHMQKYWDLQQQNMVKKKTTKGQPERIWIGDFLVLEQASVVTWWVFYYTYLYIEFQPIKAF